MEEKTVKPKQLITKEFAKLLNENYNKTRLPMINEALKKEDANAIWFPIDVLENYIKYIKAEATKQKFQIDGIRIHFGAYPEDKKYEEKSGLTTLFLAPTATKKIRILAANKDGATTEKSLKQLESLEVEALNYGSIGNPPAVSYS